MDFSPLGVALALALIVLGLMQGRVLPIRRGSPGQAWRAFAIGALEVLVLVVLLARNEAGAALVGGGLGSILTMASLLLRTRTSERS